MLHCTEQSQNNAKYMQCHRAGYERHNTLEKQNYKLKYKTICISKRTTAVPTHNRNAAKKNEKLFFLRIDGTAALTLLYFYQSAERTYNTNIPGCGIAAGHSKVHSCRRA